MCCVGIDEKEEQINKTILTIFLSRMNVFLLISYRGIKDEKFEAINEEKDVRKDTASSSFLHFCICVMKNGLFR